MPTSATDTGLVRLALIILGAAFLLCLGGIIALAMANPARDIPDVLVVTIGTISGAIAGILPGAIGNRRPA